MNTRTCGACDGRGFGMVTTAKPCSDCGGVGVVSAPKEVPKVDDFIEVDFPGIGGTHIGLVTAVSWNACKYVLIRRTGACADPIGKEPMHWTPFSECTVIHGYIYIDRDATSSGRKNICYI